MKASSSPYLQTSKATVVKRSAFALCAKTTEFLEKLNYLGDICISNTVLPSHIKLEGASFGTRVEGCDLVENTTGTSQYLTCKVVECKQPLILNSIIDIKFTMLLKLSLRGNRIESVEFIPLIKMPLLEKLLLSANNIINLSCLRKAHLPCL
jgi:Leucine-rich repeat (LRR) protein